MHRTPLPQRQTEISLGPYSPLGFFLDPHILWRLFCSERLSTKTLTSLQGQNYAAHLQYTTPQKYKTQSTK